MVDLSRAAAIVGVYEHPTRYAPDKSDALIQAESALKALEEAGLEKKDVDALFSAGAGSGMDLCDYLNLYPRYVDNTQVGGGSFEFHLSHALSGIATNRFHCALITYGAVSRSQGVNIGTGGFQGQWSAPLPDSFEVVYGTTTVGIYALVAQHHMYQYGTTSAQLAEIAVAMRHHAGMNPHAMFRDPITVEDILTSRMISTPLHLLDCCVISDGGGAVVVASPEVARNCKTRPVWVLGTGEAVAHQGAGARDLTTIAAAQSAPRALEMAGVGHEDINLLMCYDSFTITVLTTVEGLGFCQVGEGGDFVIDGSLQMGGRLPTNTDGGGLSSNHPGMRGIFLLIEATKQLRGDFAGTPRQVANCGIALCHGTGGGLGTRHSGGTVVLARE